MFNKMIWIRVLGLLSMGLLIFGVPSEDASSSTTGTFSSPIAFIDQTSVDLHWDHPDPSYNVYIISRDGTPIFATDTAVTFYRDSGLTQGQTYVYQIDAFEDDEHKLSSGPKPATAGEIGGTLYQNKVWVAGTYVLYNHIDIRPGVSFEIQPGAVVDTVSFDTKSISDGAGGQLTITNVAMKTNVILFQASSVLSGVTFSDASTLYYERTDTFNAPNTFTDAARLLVGYHTDSWPTIQGQTFNNSGQLVVQGGALVVVKQCSFDQANIEISDGGMATITGNTFRNGGSDLSYSPAIVIKYTSGDVDINDNQFEDAGIRIDATTADIIIEGNTIAGGNTGHTGILVRGTPEIKDNSIFDWGYGIYYSGSQSGGTVTGNTIALNTTGVKIDTDAMPDIQQNCIAGNSAGAYVGHSRTKIVNLRANWWGSSSGPYNYETNPDGTGNQVYGNMVDFWGWLQTDNCQVLDIETVDLEAVQVIQSASEDVSAVAGRETIVRAYADARIGTASSIEGELHGYRDGAYLGMLTSENSITVQAMDDIMALRGDLKNGAVYFELPETWITPGVLTYTVALNPDNAPVELRTDNNVLTSTVSFIDQNPFRIAYVPILYKLGSDEGVTPAAGKILKAHSFLQSIFPHAEVEMGLFPTLTWEKQMRGAGEHDESKNGDELLNILSIILIHWNLTHPPEERFNQIMGVFPDEVSNYGYSDPRWALDDQPAMGLGLATYCEASGHCFAHEIGHNLGLHHTNVTGKDCYAPDSDSYWNQIYLDNTIANFGYYDVRNELVPATRPDIMSYCGNSWISSLHWEMLLSANGAPQPPYEGEVSVTATTPTATQNAAPTAETTYLLVRAWTSFEGVTEFLPFWTTTSTSLPVWTPDNGSDYCVRMKDGSGNTIEEKCMDAHFYNHETYSWTITKHMLVALPIPASYAAQNADGALSGIAEISVFSDKFSQDVATLQPSAHQPTVEFISPAAGAALSGDTQITWSGADADHDPLVYSIFYRPAASAPWIPLVVDTAENSYLAMLQDLPAGSAGQFKVAVSDGYHVVDALSGTVAVPERGPAVYLLSPVTNENYASDIYLSGYGHHPDHGLLPAESLTWTSDRDGALGTGNALTVTLSVGTHRVTLTGFYDDQTATAEASITVNAESTAISGLTILGLDEVTAGEPVTLQASLISGTDVTYTWDFGDGTTTTGKTVTHIFPLYENTYNVTLTAVNALTLRTAYKIITIKSGPASPLQRIFLPLIVP